MIDEELDEKIRKKINAGEYNIEDIEEEFATGMVVKISVWK